jgi:ribosomal protein S12 methylthiotransferase accessory factor
MSSEDRPCLVTGVAVFPDADGDLVIRTHTGAVRVEASRRPAVERVLGRLDGSHTVEEALRDCTSLDGLHALALLFRLNKIGATFQFSPTDHPPQTGSRSRTHETPGHDVAGTGLLADALRQRRPSDCGKRASRSRPCIVAFDGPDVDGILHANRQQWAARNDWMPAYPFGDIVVVGPRIRKGRGPCCRCFFLRWLGISANIELERAYLDWLRKGNWISATTVRDSQHATGMATLVDAAAGMLEDSLPGYGTLAIVRLGGSQASTVRLAPHPGCDVCGATEAISCRGRAALGAALADRQPPTALGDLRVNIASLVDVHCGLVALVDPIRGHNLPPPAGCPEIVVTRYGLPAVGEVVGEQSNWAHGAASTWQDAATIAAIEAIERYCGLSAERVDVVAPFRDVAARALPPPSLPLFSNAQYDQPGFPFHPFDPQAPARWTEGWNDTRGVPVLVPTDAVWYGTDGSLLSETSSGVAAHSSPREAVVAGVLELVERDAFMLHWLHRIAPPLLDLVGNTAASAMANAVRTDGWAVHIGDLTTDLGIPVALALAVRGDRRRPALLVGAGAALDLGTAAQRALSELYAASRAPGPGWTLRPVLAPTDVRTLEDHGRAYQHPDWLDHASFLWSSRRRRQLWPRSVDGDRLDSLVDRLAHCDHGHDVIAVDMTGPELEPTPLWVLRSIVPGLQPLGFADRVRLGGRRLWDAPANMGRNAASSESDLNRTPHCFP